MKKWMKICLIVFCVVLIWEILAWIWGFRINPFAVEKVILCSYNYENDEYHTVEVTESERWTIILLHNYCAFSLGKEWADAPPESDGLKFYLDTGNKVTIDLLRNKRFLAKPGYHCSTNSWLWDYIRELLEKYELPVW